MKRKIFIILVFILSFISNVKGSDSDNFKSKLHLKEKNVDLLVSKISNSLSSLYDIKKISTLVSESVDEDIYFYIYYKDSLIYWSSNNLSIVGIDKVLNEVEFKNLENSVCEIRTVQKGEFIIKGVIVLKYNYPYSNKYLVNNFFDNQNYSIQLLDINSINIKNSKIYLDYKEKPVFRIIELNQSQNTITNNYFQFILLVIPLLFLLIIFKISINRKSTSNVLFLLIAIALFVFGASLLNINILSIQLFNPSIFAWSNIIPSLGHLYIYSLCFGIMSLIVIGFIYSNGILPKIKKNNLYYILLLSVLVKIIILYLYFKFIEIIITNSSFSIDLSDLFSLNFYSLIVLIVMFILSMSISYIFYYIDLINRSLQLNNEQKFFLILSLILSVIAFFIVGLIFAIVLLFILSYRYIQYKRSLNINRVSYFLGFLLLIASFTIYSFNRINYLKEHEFRKTFASKISSESDPLIEYSFFDLSENLKQNDSIIKILRGDRSEQALISYINKELLKGYWDKYDVTITMCSNDDVLYLKPQNFEVNCCTYFYNKSSQIGVPTKFSNLFLLEYENYKTNYIGVIELESASLNIEFSSKKATLDLTYPKLLLDEKYTINTSNYKYSYAKYVHAKLTSHSGNYFYNQQLKLHNNNPFYKENDYSHYHYKYDSKTDYIISKPAKKFVGKLAPLPILLFIFFILFQLSLFVCYPTYVSQWIKQITFKNRLQVTIISIILLSFVSIGYWSINYIKTLNDEKSKEILTEKTHSILLEMQSKIKNKPEILKNKPELEGYLVKFSNVFFTDINVYNTYGEILASSRAKIFEEGLLSKMMNRTSFEGFLNDKKTMFIHKEKIGKLEYWSAYMPLRNSNDEILGYINLPYYARQTDLQEELSGFISAFLNIYFVIIGLSIVIVLLISNYIVRPLNLIKEHISALSISKKNEKIVWKSNDEIGALVTEYNRMVDELVSSADRLVQSEREGAWREMAKQVAHEIKNPLTPMRLSIQNLYRAWEDKAPDWESRFIRFKDMALEQIDTLSVIASEFSNFAKMPYPQKQQIDIIKIISSVVNLFKDIPDKEILIQTELNNILINADKDQILRVFTNLIKNSVQALDEINNAKIQIQIQNINDNVIIKIIDNGHGISEEMSDKIFKVNFTTKSGGTGLGLAMVKNIIENHGGKIYFKSTPYLETIFIVELPIYS